jgi:hypothetical protein
MNKICIDIISIILMTKFGLIITINKFNNYFETIQTTYVFDTIDEAKNKLLTYLGDQFKHLNIDFPIDFIDFEYMWFKEQYINTNAFNYKIFNNDEWTEPWDTQEIYSDVIELMIEAETKIPIDFSQLYGEPDPDENVNDNFTMEPTEQMQELENKLKEIISQAKTMDIQTDQVKECPCSKCLEGANIQSSMNSE